MWEGFKENNKKENNIESLSRIQTFKTPENKEQKDAIKTKDRTVFTQEGLVAKIKEELMNELKKEFDLVPKGTTIHKLFSTADLLRKYSNELCEKAGLENNSKNLDRIGNGIRRCVNLHLGYNDVRKITGLEEQTIYLEEFEKFIVEYILGKKEEK